MEAPGNKYASSTGILPNCILTPPVSHTDALRRIFFAEKEKILLKQHLDFEN